MNDVEHRQYKRSLGYLILDIEKPYHIIAAGIRNSFVTEGVAIDASKIMEPGGCNFQPLKIGLMHTSFSKNRQLSVDVGDE